MAAPVTACRSKGTGGVVMPAVARATAGPSRCAFIDQSIADDDEDRPLNQRAWVRQILEEPDPRGKLRLHAQGIRQVLHRVTPIDRMLRSAAEVDPDAASQRAKTVHQRLKGMQEFADTLDRGGHLRADLTPAAAAAERICVLIDPEIYRLTTDELGWPREQYEEWPYELLVASLLPPLESRKRRAVTRA